MVSWGVCGLLFSFEGVATVPVANSFSVTFDEDNQQMVNFASQVIDSDKDVTFFEIVTNDCSLVAMPFVQSTTGAGSVKGLKDKFGSCKFTYLAKDATGNVSNQGVISVTVNAVNDSPVLKSCNAVTTDDQTAAFIKVNVEDVEKESVNFSVVTPPTLGNLQNSPLKAMKNYLMYVPPSDFAGEERFDLRAEDGSGGVSNQISCAVKVTHVDRPMTVESTLALETAYETSYEFTIKADDPDAEKFGDVIFYAVQEDPQHGTVTLLEGATFRYTPEAGYSGTDALVIQVSSSGNDGEVFGVEVAVTVLPEATEAKAGESTSGSDEVTSTETETASELSESAGTESETASSVPETTVELTVNENETLKYEISGLAEGEACRLKETGQAVVRLTNDNLVYVPDADFNGDDTVEVSLYDAEGNLKETLKLVIHVEGENQPPEAASFAVETKAGQQIKFSLMGEDAETENLDYEVEKAPAHGVVTLNDGKAVYVAEENYFGTDEFQYRSIDAEGAKSEAATVSLNVAEVPDATWTETHCPAYDVSDHLKKVEGEEYYYWDHLLEVTFNSQPDATEKSAMESEIGGTIACYFENDEATTPWSVYTLEVSASSLEELKSKADAFVAAHAGVKVYPIYEGLETTDGSVSFDSDSEWYSWNSGVESSADFDIFNMMALPAARDYIRALALQGFSLQPVEVAIGDTGVCASADYQNYCAFEVEGLTQEFEDVIEAGNGALSDAVAGAKAIVDASPLYIGLLDTSTSAKLAAVTEKIPYALVDRHHHFHGTNVAALAGAKDNGTDLPIISDTIQSEVLYDVLDAEGNLDPASKYSRSTGFDQAYKSGVLGGIPSSRFDYTLKSYFLKLGNSSAFNDFTVLKKGSEIIENAFDLSGATGSDVFNGSFAVDYCPRAFVDCLNAGEYYKMKRHEARTLYVFALANDGTDLDSLATSLSKWKATLSTTMGYTLENTLGIAAVTLDAESGAVRLSDVSNTSTQPNVMAAPGEYTSYAAPLASGTAGLMKSVYSQLSPKEIKNILLQTATPTDDSQSDKPIPALLNASAAVLAAIDARDTENRYSPLRLKSAHFESAWDSGYFLQPAGGKAGEYKTVVSGSGWNDGFAFWKHEDGKLEITRETNVNGQLKDDFDPYPAFTANANAEDEFLTALKHSSKPEVSGQLESKENFSVGLMMTADPEDANHGIPVMTALPQGKQSYQVEGKFTSGGYDAELTWSSSVATATNAINWGVSYCLDFSMNVNEDAEALKASQEAGKHGFIIPLAPSKIGPYSTSENTLTLQATVPYHMKNAKLTGRAHVYAHYDSDLLLARGLGGRWKNFVTYPDSKEITAENMEIPDCQVSALPEKPDNEALENALWEWVEEGEWSYEGWFFEQEKAAYSLGESDSFDMAQTKELYEKHPIDRLYYWGLRNANEASENMSVLTTTPYLYYDFEITFEDTQCDVELSVTRTDKGYKGDTFKHGDGYFNTFETAIEKSPTSPACLVKANVTIKGVAMRDYSGGGFGDYRYYSNFEDSRTEEVSFSLASGEIPFHEVLNDVLLDQPESVLNAQLPKSLGSERLFIPELMLLKHAQDLPAIQTETLPLTSDEESAESGFRWVDAHGPVESVNSLYSTELMFWNVW